MKKKLIVANWKLNGNIEMISNYLKFLKNNLLSNLNKNIIVIAPPNIYLERTYQSIKKINIFLGAQNVDVNLKGAFTGEVSVLMLKDIGVKYVIIGHSERRILHNETDNFVAKKFHLIKNSNLIPILCIGETEKEKKNGKTQKVIEKQLNCIFQILGEKAFRNAVIAYEPIWAIGTGVSADPEYVQIIHKFIRNYIQKNDSVSKNVIIQYGGSVSSLNTKEFIQQEDIDGLLIGSASLHAKEFLKIIKISCSID
ncbi:MAG: triose-phosphate isomerase [Buchnera aphidicola (Brevicoryne brassicae)]|uniref:Triosephosphate isomerase n=1 Tax=Buchnera aphidicola (Brevicoryne brassicae) TaxID=911343 RepID=A0AAJ5TX31_9GAMM|nr:triose-phosphate isomerase [Buchnera aphidicola]QCI19870.1 triose-phosphate isomerase [Buchnera aphidicola (Brevicoryne brassicae)]WAI18692.1 MAG: triose-phosphate isomerase [Buchnera aphidicola (Brevicoryne brassicae)]